MDGYQFIAALFHSLVHWHGHARYARKNDKPVVAFENELSGVSLKHGYE